MNITKYQPNRQLWGVSDEFNRVFDRLFNPAFQQAGETTDASVWAPRVDVSEDDHNFYLQAELPGIDKSAIRVNIENNILTLEGERTDETKQEGKNWHRIERTYGRFYRAFRLPATVNRDAIEANFRDGILYLQIPKSDEAKPKQIAVTVN